MRLIALLLLPLFTSCQLIQIVTPQQTTYQYLRPVRAESLLKQQDHDEIVVPLRFTGPGLMTDSAICFHHAETEVHGREIRVTMFTALCNDYGTPVSHSLRIKGLTLPEYDLVFIDPDGTRHPFGKLRR